MLRQSRKWDSWIYCHNVTLVSDVKSDLLHCYSVGNILLDWSACVQTCSRPTSNLNLKDMQVFFIKWQVELLVLTAALIVSGSFKKKIMRNLAKSAILFPYSMSALLNTQLKIHAKYIFGKRFCCELQQDLRF